MEAQNVQVWVGSGLDKDKPFIWDFCDYLPKRAEANTTYSITCKSQYLPGKIATSVKLSTGYTGRALSFAKVQVIAENDCKKDMEGKSYRCEAC